MVSRGFSGRLSKGRVETWHSPDHLGLSVPRPLYATAGLGTTPGSSAHGAKAVGCRDFDALADSDSLPLLRLFLWNRGPPLRGQ